MSQSRRMILDYQKAAGKTVESIVEGVLAEPCASIKEIFLAELRLVRSWPTIQTAQGPILGVYLSETKALTPNGILTYQQVNRNSIGDGKEELSDYVTYRREAIAAIAKLQQGL